MIKDARQIQRVTNYRGYVKKYDKAIADVRRRGDQVVTDPVVRPVAAVIEQGRWMFVCPCGSGVAVHPEWPDARCFECGRIFAAVVVPVDRARIESVLTKRPMDRNRNWTTETVDELLEENRARGVKDDVVVDEARVKP